MVFRILVFHTVAMHRLHTHSTLVELKSGEAPLTAKKAFDTTMQRDELRGRFEEHLQRTQQSSVGQGRDSGSGGGATMEKKIL